VLLGLKAGKLERFELISIFIGTAVMWLAGLALHHDRKIPRNPIKPLVEETEKPMPAPDDTSRIDAIFAEARAIADSTQRTAYLEQACGKNKTLRVEVESLLDADRGAADFMRLQPLPVLETLPGAKAGDSIGRYKLLEKIGEGGFGEVWMAEQQEPVQRKVALKIIKAGMDTREVVARFEAERQALALMDHPNIAKVLDGGTTGAERPYFVMELVRGIPVTDYCDQSNLPTIERLQLFIKVCQAVQHAHQKAVIHRDLKPSNILVTLHDGEPVPKVIDFGVAKALGQKLTEKTLFTSFRQMIGTPAYMSPEQAEMSGLDIDTRSDIYSLGVLLYELLTGVTPFDKEVLAKAALDEIRRMIRETEPPKPSTRLRTLGDRLPEVARHRRTEPATLSRLVHGDLDWIVMKCLEKDRKRRYETANGLARDIERFRNNEPVSAAAPSALYRAQKFVRRHQAALTIASALVMLLAAGVVVSTLEAHRAKRAEQAEKVLRQQAEKSRANEASLRLQAEADEKRAKTEATRSREVADFLQDMLKGVGPSVALGRDTTLLREILDKTAGRVGRELKDQPDVEAELRDTLGEIYRELSHYEEAETMHRQALAIRRKLWGDEHPAVASSLSNLGLVLWSRGKLAEAEAVERKSLEIRRKLFGPEHPAVATSLNNLALVLKDQGKLPEAESAFRQTLALDRKMLGSDDPELGRALDNLGTVLRPEGKLAEAETMHREALAVRRKLFGGEHPEVADSLNNLAVVLSNEGKLAEAETIQREALSMMKKLLGSEHQRVATTLGNLAYLLFRQGKLSEAETMQRETLAMRRKLLGDEHLDVASSLHDLALTLRERGSLSEAEALLREALACLRKASDSKTSLQMPFLGVVLHHLADLLREQQSLAEARLLAEEAATLYRSNPGWPPREKQHAFQVLGGILIDLGDLAGAEAVWREQVESLRARPADDLQLADALASLTVTLLLEQKFVEAEPLARECLTIFEKNQVGGLPTFRARMLLGEILVAQENYTEGEPLLLSGFEGVRRLKDGLPPYIKQRVREDIKRIAQRYEGANRTAQAREWSQRLSDFH
jgi:tetratricopeptide (TPR) repeat protein